METWRALGPVDAALKKMRLRQIGGVLLLILGIALLLMSLRMDRTQSETTALTAVTGSDQSARFRISLLTKAFATSKPDEQQYYLASDGTSIRIVMLRSETYAKCRNILDYTYGVTEDKPQSITVTGLSGGISEQLRSIAIDAYKELFNPGISKETVSSILGEYLLVEGENRHLPIENIGIGLVLELAGIILFFSARSDRKDALVSLASAEEKGWIQPLADNFKKAAVFSRLDLISDGEIFLTVGKYIKFQSISEMTTLRLVGYSQNYASPIVALQGTSELYGKDEDQWITLISGRNDSQTMKEFSRLITLIHEKCPEKNWMKSDGSIRTDKE